MSCILRAGGENFEVEKFIEQNSMKPDSFWKKGDPCFSNSNTNFKLNETSGIRVLVSEADFLELPQQIEDAILFFAKHKSEIVKLTSFQGVEDIDLDFGTEAHQTRWSSFTFPPQLMLLVGTLGVSLCISIYPFDEELVM
ncbi:MAG: hypothetical protein HOO87_15770 [Methyloglobulus sp.]|nr:hypothetical protein [Methyloglobulus sp.]